MNSAGINDSFFIAAQSDWLSHIKIETAIQEFKKAYDMLLVR